MTICIPLGPAFRNVGVTEPFCGGSPEYTDGTVYFNTTPVIGVQSKAALVIGTVGLS
jgi:hypothetical protein